MKLIDEVEFEEHPNSCLASLTVRKWKVIKTVTVTKQEEEKIKKRKRLETKNLGKL